MSSSSYRNASGSNNKLDLLMEACAIGNIVLVEDLIDQIKDINQVNKVNGWSCLHWATSRKQLEIVSILLNNGANPHLKDRKEVSPYDMAFKSDDIELKDLFIISQEHERNNFIDPTISSQDDKTSNEIKASQEQFVPNYLKYPDFNKLWASAKDYNLTSTASNTHERPSSTLKQQKQQNQDITKSNNDSNQPQQTVTLHSQNIDDSTSLSSYNQRHNNSDVPTTTSTYNNKESSIILIIHYQKTGNIIGLYPLHFKSETISQSICSIFNEMDILFHDQLQLKNSDAEEDKIQHVINKFSFYFLKDDFKIPFNKRQFQRKMLEFTMISNEILVVAEI